MAIKKVKTAIDMLREARTTADTALHGLQAAREQLMAEAEELLLQLYARGQEVDRGIESAKTFSDLDRNLSEALHWFCDNLNCERRTLSSLASRKADEEMVVAASKPLAVSSPHDTDPVRIRDKKKEDKT
jgi:hypothetical protein